jgi:tetratricopeptide (TPR) repeat protein
MIQYGIMTTGLASDPGFTAIAEEALAALGEQRTASRARLQAALATEVMQLDPGRARSLLEDATDIARALGDPETLGEVLYSSRFGGHEPGDIAAATRAADELIAIGHRTGQTTFTIVGLETRAAALREAGDLVACDRAVETYAGLLDTSALPHVRAFLALFRSSRQALAGELAAAERTAREILELAKRGNFDPANWYGSALWTIRHSQHRLGRFAPFYRRGVLKQPGLDDYLSAILALARLQAGRTNDAHAELDRFATTDFVDVRPNFLWTVKLAMLCETAEMTGHAAAGAQLLELLRPHSGALAANVVLVFEPIDLALAQAALAAGDYETAEAFAARAVAASRHRRTPIFLGRELIRLAAARHHLSSDGETIAGLVGEALDIADRTGAALIRREAEHYQLCAAGVDKHS